MNVVVYDPKKDVYKEDSNLHMKWSDQSAINPDGSGKYLTYRHHRVLSNKDCQTALDYIAALTKVYPVQLRYAMSRPLWTRFCEAYCDSGDMKMALNSI